MADDRGGVRSRRPGIGAVLVLAGVIAVAVNLRTSITVVGPLIPTIREATGASNVALGLVGSIPVLAFGLMSPIAPVIGRRLGIGRSLAASMVLLAVAITLRSAGGFAWLLVGTTLLGVAIAVGNVLLPALIKGRFPHRVSQLTTVYSAAMVLAATVSAGVAVPLAERFSWEVSAGVWALPALLGAGVIMASLLLEGRLVPASTGAPASTGLPMRRMYRSRLAWQVTAFMGLQSTMFYVTLAWLPDILIERGMTDLQAGFLVGVFNSAGLLGVLLIPLLHRRRADQRRSTLAASLCSVLGAVALLVPGTGLAPVAAVMLGLGSGGTIGLVLSFFALRTATASDAASLSGMAQTWGYLVSAMGPVLWGALRDLTGSWTMPLVLLVVVTGAITWAGALASRDRVLA